jgi:hypothetical protein
MGEGGSLLTSDNSKFQNKTGSSEIETKYGTSLHKLRDLQQFAYLTEKKVRRLRNTLWQNEAMMRPKKIQYHTAVQRLFYMEGIHSSPHGTKQGFRKHHQLNTFTSL